MKSTDRVADMTLDELQSLIRETVRQAMAERERELYTTLRRTGRFSPIAQLEAEHGERQEWRQVNKTTAFFEDAKGGWE
jgi:hypothetical protein